MPQQPTQLPFYHISSEQTNRLLGVKCVIKCAQRICEFYLFYTVPKGCVCADRIHTLKSTVAIFTIYISAKHSIIHSGALLCAGCVPRRGGRRLLRFTAARLASRLLLASALACGAALARRAAFRRVAFAICRESRRSAEREADKK